MHKSTFDRIVLSPDAPFSPVGGGLYNPVYENSSSPIGVSRRFQAGYLSQRNVSVGFFKSWKKRYFRLRDDGILCYKSQEQTNFRSVIKFTNETKIAWHAAKPYCFCVENAHVVDEQGARIYQEEPVVLQASSEADRNQWAAAIRIKIEMRKQKAYLQPSYDSLLSIDDNGEPSSSSNSNLSNSIVRRAVNSVLKRNSPVLDNAKDRFHSQYSIGAQIGAGSFSIVRKAIDRHTGAIYAEKSVTITKALRQEVSILKKLHHPNVIRLIDFFECGDICHVITDYMKDGDLCDKLMELVKYPEDQVQIIIGKCLRGIEYFHSKNIIHRDIKPENILLHGEHVKIADFGLAQQLSSSLEMLESTCGTPEYAAPELLEGKPYGLSSDIFSLGVVTYIMLIGAFPFGVESAQALQQLESFRDGAIARRMTCLAPDSEQWQGVSELARDAVVKMLESNPDLRISASGLLQHAWFKDVILSQEEANDFEKKREEQVLYEGFKMLLLEGIVVIKYGRKGNPHATKIYLDGSSLKWHSKHRYLRPATISLSNSGRGTMVNGADCDPVTVNSPLPSQTKTNDGIALDHISEVRLGKATDVFQRHDTQVGDENHCFSLVTSTRTLDLELPTVEQRNFLVAGFNRIIAQKSL